jgi:hypothetical protein
MNTHAFLINSAGLYSVRRCTSSRVLLAAAIIALGSFLTGGSAIGQGAPTADTSQANGFDVHQSIELGGHIADNSGSSAMYSTLVNLRTGPRILSQSLEMRAVGRPGLFFDDLSTNSFGYGGDPNTVSVFQMSKGTIYSLRGTFRRDRQYFDYDLLANPLVPVTVPYLPVLTSPHLFNTVRRMTDINLTVLPTSAVSFRLGYSHNISEGPSFSSLHTGTEALLLQNWQNLTDSGIAGVDWKVLPQTTLSFDEIITSFKSNTNWQLAGLNSTLANGQPVSYGLDVPFTAGACQNPNAGGVGNPKCNAYLGYSRSGPVRGSFPTEQLRFQSSSIARVNMNGRVLYSTGTSKLNDFSENFDGLITRTSQRGALDTGLASTKRISVAADYGVSIQVSPKVVVSDVFNFLNWRAPGTNNISETDLYGSSLLVKPNLYSPTTCPPPYTAKACPTHTAGTGPDFFNTQYSNFLGQKTITNAIVGSWDILPRARITLGYRYRTRTVNVAQNSTIASTYDPPLALRGACVGGTLNPDGSCTSVATAAGANNIPIHSNGAIFGIALQPTSQWRINFNVDATYADNAFVRIDPRQIEQYRLRTTYRPKNWMTFSGSVSDLESRDNVQDTHYLEHARDFSLGAAINPSEHWGLDLNYAYDNIHSTIDECYIATPAPANAVASSATSQAAGLPFVSPGLYDQPTQYGSISFMLDPVKRVHANLGYRMSAVDGTTDTVAPRQVPGSLQSQYQTPFGDVAVNIAPQWIWKANWNYYGYGEGSPIGPTTPRSFRGNVYTLSVKYAF